MQTFLQILFLLGFATPICGQTTPEEAAKAFRLYAKHIQSNYESIQTLKGQLTREVRTPSNQAVFYRDRGPGAGPEEVVVPGDIIMVHRTLYSFSWDIATDSQVLIAAPTDKPCRYIDTTTQKELVPDFKNCVMGTEEKVVTNSTSMISCFGNRKSFELTKKLDYQAFHGSPKSLFFCWANERCGGSDFLGSFAESIEKEGHDLGIVNLEVKGDLHLLSLTVNKGTENEIVYEFVFDAARNFVLQRYRDQIKRTDICNNREWTYRLENKTYLPTKLVTRATKIDGELQSEEVIRIKELLVNPDFSEEEFSLAALKPGDGDLLIDKELGLEFEIRNHGRELIPRRDAKK